MANLIAFRDAAFWWIGVWALITMADGVILSIVLAIRGSGKHGHSKEEHSK